MTTTLNLPGSGTTTEDNGIRIYGPEIRGPARKVAIVFWGGILLICLLVFGLSMDKIDRDSRMTCADQARTYPDMDHHGLCKYIAFRLGG